MLEDPRHRRRRVHRQPSRRGARARGPSRARARRLLLRTPRQPARPCGATSRCSGATAPTRGGAAGRARASRSSSTRRRCPAWRAPSRIPLALAPRQRHRHPHHAGGRARRRRAALRLRGLVVRLRRRAGAAQARGHGAAAALALRGGEARRASTTCASSPTLYGMETLTLRYFNVFGPRQDPGSPYSGVISLFVDRAARGASARSSTATAGRAATSRTSRTSCTATCAPSRRRGLAGQAVNVATGRRVTLRELLDRAGARDRRVRREPEHRPPPAGRRPAQPGRHPPRRGSCSATGRSWTSRPASRRTVDWYRGVYR